MQHDNHSKQLLLQDQHITTSGMNVLPFNKISHGTAVNNTFRQVLSSIGTAPFKTAFVARSAYLIGVWTKTLWTGIEFLVTELKTEIKIAVPIELNTWRKVLLLPLNTAFYMLYYHLRSWCFVLVRSFWMIPIILGWKFKRSPKNTDRC